MTYPGPWVVVFHEHGGYDALTAAYEIVDASGRSLARLDLADFLPPETPWDIRHAEHAEVRQVAECMASAWFAWTWTQGA